MEKEETKKKPRKKDEVAKVDEPTVEKVAVVAVEQELATTVEPHLPLEFLSVIASSGIQEKKAVSYVVKYIPLVAEIKAEAEKLVGLNPESDDDAAIAKRVSINLGSICSKLTEQKKLDKEGVLKLGRFFDGLYNAANDLARAEQDRAKEIATMKEKQIELAEKEAELIRVAELRRYYAGEIPALGKMDEEVFQNMLAGFKAKHDAAEELRRAEEAEQVAAEQAAKDLAAKVEADRLAEVENLKKLAAEQKAKSDALAADAAKKEAESKAEQKRLEAIAAEQQRRADKMAKELEVARLSKEEADKRLADADKTARKELERVKALSVQQQIIEWLNKAQMEKPPVDNETTQTILIRFEGFRSWALEQVKKSES